MSATVKYQVGTYKGTVTVQSSVEDDDATLIARAKRRLFSPSGLLYGVGMSCEHFEVVERDEE